MKDTLLERAAGTIRKYGMIPPGCGVVAGVSGGADSVCLLLTLAAYRERVPFTLSVLHVEHGIRGQESLEDQAFTQRLCSRLQIPCTCVHVDALGQERAPHAALEERARLLRYEALERERARTGALRIAIAHHRDDQAETVLMNLARGSGLKGLGGMRPVNGALIRPLLEISGSEIRAWLARQGQTWREDSTNRSMAHTRNRVRHSVLPVLEEQVNRQAAAHIADAALLLQETWDFLQRQSDELAGGLIDECPPAPFASALRTGGAEWAGLPPLLRREMIRRCLEKRGNGAMRDITAEHYAALEELSLGAEGRRISLPGGGFALKAGGSVLFSGRDPGAAEQAEHVVNGARVNSAQAGKDREDPGAPVAVDLDRPGEYELSGCRFSTQVRRGSDLSFPIPADPCTKWLSCDTILGRLVLRTRRHGDYLVIDRQGRRKKLKEYLIDEKVPAHLRDEIVLLADGSRILWVSGYRISEDARVYPETERVLCIRMLPSGGR